MTTLTHSPLTDYQLSHQHPGVLSRVADTVRVWRRRTRERQMLAELTVHDLSDFGASSADRFNELAKPFWRD